jgi:hypothetical protein
MATIDVQRELHKAEAERLMPTERKLIAWSFAVGLVLLALFSLLNRSIIGA